MPSDETDEMSKETSHYTVLARRCRPQSFADVVGQEPVARALTNAIAAGRVAHAYLFTGARGVGKTSMARILAKALNCPNLTDGQPCNTCEICRGIAAGNDVDVLEIDGASNRGIDDIRSLRANVNVKSMRTKYKMYIIDEVHMLTREAFNALLKTLEEPPPNVKFVFCTTEPNKVPDTILSRCQRFDFSTIDTPHIAERLRQIAEAEGFQVSPAALELVARRAAGSMRDSQSLLDQLLAFGGDVIDVDDVHRLLGTAGDDRLIELAAGWIDHRPDRVLELFDGSLAEGAQLEELVDQLLSYLRDLMVTAAGANQVPLLAVSAESRDTVTEQGRQWGLPTIVAAMQILADTKKRMFRAGYGRALAEMALVRIAMLEDLESLGRIIREIADGTAGSTGSAVASPRPVSPLTGASADRSNTRPVSKSTSTAEKKTTETVSTAVSDHPSAVSAQGDDLPTSGDVIEFRDGCERKLWTQIVSSIDDMLKDHVGAVSDVAISGPNRLDLMFPRRYAFSKTYCERPEVLGRLEKLAASVAGKPIRIAFRIVEEDTKSTLERTADSRPGKPGTGPVNDPFVERAAEVFGASIVRVEETSPRLPQQE